MATQGEDPAGVFQELVPVISPLIGRHFTNVTNGLFGKRIITRQEKSRIKTTPNLNEEQRGSEVAFLLYDKIKESGDPVQCLLKICDVFESDLVNDASLKKHGANMRSKFTRVSPAPQVQPTRVQPITTPRASEDRSIPPNNDTPTATADSTKMLEMENKVAQQPELKEAAYKLRQKYIDLKKAVLQSLIDQKSNIKVAKESIKDCVKREGCESDPQLNRRIDEIDKFPSLFEFLRSNNYIGYLNYKILKRLLPPQDDGLKKKVDDYETEYARFLNEICCHKLVDLFKEYRDLSPTAPVGLPCVTFHLAPPWQHKQFYTWIITFGEFSWSEYTFLMQLRKSSVIIKYAILPCVLDKAIQDLKNPSILEKLETDGITVVELPAQEERGQGGIASKRPKTTEEAAGLEEADSGTGTSTAASTVSPQATPSSDVDKSPAAPEVPAKHFPELKDIKTEYRPFPADLLKRITVLLMTATEIELRGIMGYLEPMDGTDKIIETFTDAKAGKIKFYIGKYGQYPVAVGMIAPAKGHQGPIDATNVTTKIMNAFEPRYVIAVGICYGMDRSKTSPVDVIVSDHIVDATCLRVGDTLQLRGGIHSVGVTLLSMFGSPIGYTHTQGGIEVKVHCGDFIARPDLVDNSVYKEKLKNLRPGALGGEMEGAGIMAAIRNASYVGVEAIVIKAICDWGDGKKSEATDLKPFSSHAAARYVHHQMEKYKNVLK